MSESKKKPRPRRRVDKPERGQVRNMSGMNERAYTKIRDALIEHDRVVSDYEARWGIDRLPDLVPPELRERFETQCDLLNKAIWQGDASEVARLVPVSCRAYAALEKAARENGYAELTGEAWEAPFPHGGVLCITRTIDEAAKVARERPEAVVWSVCEVANVIGSYETANAVTRAKMAFPGAVVESVAPAHKELDDEIPF